MWRLVAAELPAPVDNTSAYLVFAGVVVGAIASIAIAVIQSRKSRTEPSPPAASNGDGNGSNTIRIRERVAVTEAEIKNLKKVDEQTEETVDTLDRRVDRNEAILVADHKTLAHVVAFLNRQFPGWGP